MIKFFFHFFFGMNYCAVQRPNFSRGEGTSSPRNTKSYIQ